MQRAQARALQVSRLRHLQRRERGMGPHAIELHGDPGEIALEGTLDTRLEFRRWHGAQLIIGARVRRFVGIGMFRADTGQHRLHVGIDVDAIMAIGRERDRHDGRTDFVRHRTERPRQCHQREQDKPEMIFHHAADTNNFA